MKKVKLLLAFTLALTCLIVASCSKEIFTSDRIIGKWYVQEEAMYYDFKGDGTGSSYDQSGAGLNFTWNLSGGNVLEIRYTGHETSVSGWESFVISALSDSSMTCQDEFDSSRKLHFTRQ